MDSDFRGWSRAADLISDERSPERELPTDVASVAELWVKSTYDDLRRAGPDRATQVRWILDSYVIPWFGSRTEHIGGITYFMTHEWLLRLVGREQSEPVGDYPVPVLLRDATTRRGLSIREAAEASEVSLSTVRRRWRDGELPGAYRDANGQVRVPNGQVRVPMTTASGLRPKRAKPVGLSQPVVADALWVLRRVLGFARANGILPPGFDPTEGLEAPTPDAAVARARRPTSQPRPLNFAECARIAAHLHPVHQLAPWLQRVMGLRISEAFGVLVDDVIDLGDTGFLLVRGQGGRGFRVRDDDGRVVSVTHKEKTKTEGGTRVLVIPRTMLDLLRVVIEAFHTDPETGEVEETSRLIPGVRNDDESGQLGFRMAFELAANAEALGSEELGFRVSPHLLRKSVATDIAWHAGIEDAVRRRFMGHRASDDVFGRVYTLDHPELTPLTDVALVIEELVADSIESLLVPTTRRLRWGRGSRNARRATHVSATLGAAGWIVDPESSEDPLCDLPRVAAELGIARTTARRWMRDGTLRCVIVRDGPRSAMSGRCATDSRA